MKRTGIFARLGGALVLSTACALPLTAFGEDNGKNNGNDSERQSQQSEDKEKQDLKLKVFELEHRTPQEITQLLMLQSGATTGQAHGQPGAAQPAVAPQRPATRTTAGYRGADQPARVVAIKDEDTDFLFVRGPEKKVDEVEKLVDAFDVPADEIKKQQVGDVHLIPVRNDKGQQVQTVLGQLGLQSRMLRLGETAMIAIQADEDKKDQLEQAEKVIEKLAGDNGSSDKKSDSDSDSDNE